MGTASAGLVLLLVLLSLAGTTRGATTTPSAFFGFGDSYADTGNQNHLFAPWKYPYGITWPGYPTGRYGNGHIQTDYIAEKLGLPSPTPYADIDDQSIATGINFALGGSGVTFALGVLPLSTQLDNFELELRKGIYSSSFLADSVTLLSNVGNDYSVNYTAQELAVVIQEVIEGVTIVLERMYELGLRNILVANLPPVNCVPEVTRPSNYTTCAQSTAPLIAFHNSLLLQSVQKLNKLRDANFLILNEFDAFTYVLNNTQLYGITEALEPCCKPKSSSDSCGETDILGRHLYTLCDDPATHVYWDAVHPVESTWKAVVDLLYNESGFVIGATTLQSWLYQNSIKPPTPASAPAPGLSVSYSGALDQLYNAFEALVTDSDYAEAIGLIQIVDFQEVLAGVPEQTVTVFLPNNLAFYVLPSSTIILIYGTDQVLPVAEYHVVKGYYDAHDLEGSLSKNLTTFSGLSLETHSLLHQITVGPDYALVVDKDLYKVEGQVVVHGLGEVLIPPGLE